MPPFRAARTNRPATPNQPGQSGRSGAASQAGQPDGRGKNAVQLRRFNERLALQCLRRLGEASKAELARSAGLTNAAMGAIVSSLEAQGLVGSEGKRRDGQRGQPATVLRLRGDGAYGVGVRLDRTCIETVLIDFDGILLSSVTHEILLPPPQNALEMVRKDVLKVLELLSPERRERLAGVGLAMPFNLGCWLRELDLPQEQFRAWDGVDFAGDLEKALGIAVYTENDGTAAAIAELFYGVGRRMDDFLYLFVGPALGGGLALSGECLRGPSGNAADVALMPAPPGKLPSAIAPRGEWDILLTRASVSALKRHLRHYGVPASSRADVEAALQSGHPAVEEWLDDCAEALTPSVWAARALLDAPAVVVGTDFGGGLAGRLRDKLAARLAACAPEGRTPAEIVVGSFGSDAGAVGAASLPIFYCFSPRKAMLTNGSDG